MGWWAAAAILGKALLDSQKKKAVDETVERQNVPLHEKYTQGMEAPEYVYKETQGVDMSPQIGANVDERLRLLRQAEMQRALQGGLPTQASMPPSGYGEGGIR